MIVCMVLLVSPLLFVGSMRYRRRLQVLDVLRVPRSSSHFPSQFCWQSFVAWASASAVSFAIRSLSFRLCFCLLHHLVRLCRASNKWKRWLSIAGVWVLVWRTLVWLLMSSRSFCAQFSMSMMGPFGACCRPSLKLCQSVVRASLRCLR